MCVVFVVASCVSPSPCPVEIGFIRQFVLNANQNPNIALKNGGILGNISLKLDDAAQ